jgi:hypothetical protein
LGAGEDLVDRLRRTSTGYSQQDFRAGLEALGYVMVREVRHGQLYRHPRLAAHSDVDVRKELAQLVIPKGRELREYVAKNVLRSIEALLALGELESL